MGEEADMIPFYRPFPLPSDTNNRFRAQVLKILWTREYTKGTLSDELADKIAERTGYEFAIPVGSGTAAIMLLARWYKHLGMKRIKAPWFTWKSTYETFRWCGYDIRFVDIDRQTYLADFGDIKPDYDEIRCPVDTFGNVYPMKDARNDEYIPTPWVDSAQSLGAKWDSTVPHRILSFSGSKLITTGEGGMILTQEKSLMDFCLENDWFSRMSELQAALGLAYMDHIDEILEKKRKLAQAYRTHFKNVEWQVIPVESNDYIVAGLVDDPKKVMNDNPDVEFRRYYQSIVNEEGNDADVPHPWKFSTIYPNTQYVSNHILAFPAWPEMDIEAIKEIRI